MAIRVGYTPVRGALEMAYYAGAPEAKQFGLAEKQFKAQERERRLNRILRERVQAFTEEEARAARTLRGRQQWFREQQVPATREHEIRRMEFGAELAEKTDLRRADIAQDQAQYEQDLKARGFRLQYTMQDQKRMAELNRGMQWVRDQHAAGALNDIEAKQAMLDLHNSFNGIRKSQVPIKEQPNPEELWTQTTRTDPDFPGYVFGLDRSGAWRVLVDPTKGKEENQRDKYGLSPKERASVYTAVSKLLTTKEADGAGNMIDVPPTIEKIESYLDRMYGIKEEMPPAEVPLEGPTMPVPEPGTEEPLTGEEITPTPTPENFVQQEIAAVATGKKPVENFSPDAWQMVTGTGEKQYQHYILNAKRYKNVRELVNADPNFLELSREQQKRIYKLLVALGLYVEPTPEPEPELSETLSRRFPYLRPAQ